MKLTTWNMCKDERCTFILRCSGSSYLVAGYLDSSVPVIFRSPNPPQNDSNYSSLLLTLWTQRTTANFELRHCFTTFSDKPFWFVSLFSITNTWEFHYANIGFRRAIPEVLAGVSCLNRAYWAVPPEASRYKRWAGQSTLRLITVLKHTRHRTLS